MASHVAPFPEGGWLAQYGPPALAQLLQVLLFRSSSPLLLLDEQGVCHDASAGAARLLALPRQRLVGRKLTLTPITGAALPHRFSFPHPTPDGAPREIHCLRKPSVLPGRHLLVLDARPTSPLAIGDFACYLLDPNGCFFQWNAGATRLYGFHAAEVAGLSLALLHPTGSSPRPLLDQMADDGNPIVAEGWNLHRDQSRFWANVITTPLHGPAGERMGFAAIARDFDQRRALPTPTPPEPGFALEQKPAAIATGDCDQIRTANDSFLALTGYTRQDLSAGRLFWSDLAPAESAGLDELAHEEALRFGSCTPYATACLTREGSRVGVLATTAVLSLVPFAWITVTQEIPPLHAVDPRSDAPDAASFPAMVGTSAALRRIQRQAEMVAPTTANVLILGETGTGKELVARAIHDLSPRRNFPFITLNCAAIPTGLLESELFGYERGAFTGALNQKIGRFETAHRGTLFLDEVGDIPLELQPKLLRALQDKSFERLGGVRTIPIDVRLVAATNRNLTAMMGDKLFRPDLYYRLNVFPIAMPPLRDRPGDIPALVRHFTAKYARKMGRTITSIPAATMAALVRWHWPGNVRELENFIERSVILSPATALRAPLEEIQGEATPQPAGTLEQVERDHILRVLRECKGVVTVAATRLGLHRTTLNAMMRKLGLSRKDI